MNADGPTLQQLVLDRKGDRSYEQLAVRSGGRLTRARIQQIATRPTKAFPDPETLRGLGMALGVPIQHVVLATARSLGLDVRGAGDGDGLLIPNGKGLSWAAQEALLAIARELPRNEEPDDPQPDPPVDAAPQPDGVTNDDAGEAGIEADQPWLNDEYGLAAKRGTNRGRAARDQQDRDAEAGGA